MIIKGITVFAFIAVCLSACGQPGDALSAFESGDYEMAYELWSPLAEKGDVKAQNYLGIMYYLGLGRNKNYTRALEWYRRSAEAGYAAAQRNYADMFHFGRGTEKDIYQAYKWYFAAAQQGNASSEKQIGIISAVGNLSPNQQMYAKIEANKFIPDEEKHFMSHDTYIDKR